MAAEPQAGWTESRVSIVGAVSDPGVAIWGPKHIHSFISLHSLLEVGRVKMFYRKD